MEMEEDNTMIDAPSTAFEGQDNPDEFEFTLVFFDAHQFRTIVDNLKDLIEATNINVSPSGISFSVLDSSHVCMVALNIESSSFQYFRCQPSGSVIGVKFLDIMPLIKTAPKGKPLVLRHNREKCLLYIEFSTGLATVRHQYKLMEIESDILSPPSLDMESRVSMPSTLFSRVCKEIEHLSDVLTIDSRPDCVIFCCSGDKSSGDITVRSGRMPDNSGEVCVEIAENLDGVCVDFSMRHLCLFAKTASALGGVTTLDVYKESPLLVYISLGTSAQSHLSFFLAPKIPSTE